MARSSAILQTDTDRAPWVAQTALCVLAAACVAGGVMGLRGRGPGAAPHGNDAAMAQAEAALLNAAATRHAPPPAPVAPPSLPATLPPIPSIIPSAPPPLSPATVGAPSSAIVPALSPPPAFTVPSGPAIPAFPPVTSSLPVPAKPSTPKPSLPAHKQLKNVQVIERVMAARALRDSQDMLSAIEELKSADLREPNHPEILGEMALTYEAMHNKPRAETLWRQIYAMGESEAGGYYTIAASKIGNSSGSGGPSAPPSPVSLGPCSLKREPIPNQGERVSLSLPILASPGATIDPAKLKIYVTFYESVNNGERIDKMPDNRGSQSWATLPLDWREPTGEIVDATCNIFTKAQGSQDKREFHGYAVQLFYEDLLAGQQSQPETLLNGGAGKSTGPSGLSNALFPK
jgi:hypothetical protein